MAIDRRGNSARAEIDAYRQGLFHRTGMLLGNEGMEALRARTVAIAGCGGVGGACAITLARLGVGGFVLADPGRFDPPDGNRQWASSRATQGRNKAEVYAELLEDIHPGVRLTVHAEGVTEDNLEAFLAPADLLIDCLDISVPLDLRSRVYRTAQAAGMYAVTAPIFGFGTLVIFAAPGGMGMDELIADFVRVASEESKLPPGFPDVFFGPHLAPIEREIHKHRVPTSGIAVVMAAGVVCADVARLFLADQYPELPGPVCLPDTLVVEPLRRTYRVVSHAELFGRPSLTRAARTEALAAAHHNTALLPADAVACDLLSDSWADLPLGGASLPEGEPTVIAGLLADRYGLPHCAAFARGRLAEAVVLPLLARRGTVAATNALFPTTRFHLEQAGVRCVELGDAALDLDALDALLDSEPVGLVVVELCSNAGAGQPLTAAHMEAIAARAHAAGAKLVLDVARALDNAVLCGTTARALCTGADLVVGSLTKDLRCPAGAFVATSDEALAVRIADRATVMVTDGLRSRERRLLAGALMADPDTGVAARVEAVAALVAALAAAGLPVVQPAGGHAAYVDAARVLPHLPVDQRPADALAAALYVASGLRTARNLASPLQEARGLQLLRLPVPVGIDRTAAHDHLVAELAALAADPGRVPGLVARGGPPGVLGAFATHFEEVRP